ncbi:hypothetical protein F5X98DRAFT_15770 [Xylaria grammica]|nr:hypothetical protein F5X98DRAFT_15770 [Xylaria grammica]
MKMHMKNAVIRTCLNRALNSAVEHSEVPCGWCEPVLSKWCHHEERKDTTMTDRTVARSTGPVRSQPATTWTQPHLSDRRDGSGSGDFGVGGDLTTSGGGDSVLLRAISRDMAGLAALVAGLTGRVEGAAIRGGAIARDVAKLATGIAFHSLGLAVPGEMVGATALVAGRMARATGETTASITTKTATSGRRTTTHVNTGRAGASPCKMARLPTVVAAAVSAGGATQAEGRAISLNMAQSLAVVALLSLRCSGEGALVGFMAFLTREGWLVNAIVVKSQNGSRAYLAACSCSRGARRTSKPRRSDQHCHTCSMLYVIGKTWQKVC